jgi:hypothetical protein
MAKIDLSKSGDILDLAISYSNAAERDPNDPASSNLLLAIHRYFESVSISLIEIAKGIDSVSERLEKLERNAAGPLSTRLK